MISVMNDSGHTTPSCASRGSLVARRPELTPTIFVADPSVSNVPVSSMWLPQLRRMTGAPDMPGRDAGATRDDVCPSRGSSGSDAMLPLFQTGNDGGGAPNG